MKKDEKEQFELDLNFNMDLDVFSDIEIDQEINMRVFNAPKVRRPENFVKSKNAVDMATRITLEKDCRIYAIIDWQYRDVWKYLIEGNFKYNKIYDKMYMLGHDIRTMRVSNLVHEKAFRCLTDLQELEPETYERLEKRLMGVHTAAIYGKENLIYSIKSLPEQFKTWKEYKDFLLESIHSDLCKLFKYQWSRFGETDDIGACKYMVKRILLCDWEGSITWARDNEFNYTKDQILHKNVLKREDEIIKKWTESL